MSTKYASLLGAGICRKPGRTALTVFQIVIAFALFGVLQGIKTGVDQAIAVALAKNRTGALVSAELEKKYGWKPGDAIPLLSPTTPQIDGSDVWTFNVVGTYAVHEIGGVGNDLIVVNNHYLDEARSQDRGTVQHFHVVTTDPQVAIAVSDAIDHEFANSANETRTESYRESAQRQMQSIGDPDFAIRSIVSAVFVALLFSTATMMAQSIRERTV
jgi:putative ABC transport system permease protein